VSCRSSEVLISIFMVFLLLICFVWFVLFIVFSLFVPLWCCIYIRFFVSLFLLFNVFDYHLTLVGMQSQCWRSILDIEFNINFKLSKQIDIEITFKLDFSDNIGDEGARAYRRRTQSQSHSGLSQVSMRDRSILWSASELRLLIVIIITGFDLNRCLLAWLIDWLYLTVPH